MASLLHVDLSLPDAVKQFDSLSKCQVNPGNKVASSASDFARN
jgi:hypothetical protein